MSVMGPCYSVGSHGKQYLKRLVLRILQKMASDGADMTCCRRLFQIPVPSYCIL